MKNNNLPILADEEDDLNDIKQRYKNKRLESKNALLNNYRSLSLMQGDDFSRSLKKPKLFVPEDDFDDISSIYTQKENQVEHLKRRVAARDKRLSLMGD